MLSLYNALLLPVRATVPAVAAWQARSPDRSREWDERRTRVLPRAGAGTAWLHGASVGEARIVTSLAHALRLRDPDRPLAASAVTRTGRAQLPGPPDVTAAFFAPLDFPGLATRVLRALDAAALVLIETELWPNWLAEARAEQVPVVVVNGRLSPERMRRYRRFAALYRPLVQNLAAVGAQSEADAERWISLGLPPGRVRVTGNIKYDLPLPSGDVETVRREFGLSARRPVVVAGSTGQGEDEAVLEAFTRLRSRYGDAWLVLAPRHPERADDVERLVRQRGLSVGRFTRQEPASAGDRDVLLVDTVGQLSRLYRLGWAAFVGGSLVPVGGHNVLEPASLGLPVLFGPHTHHVQEPAAALEASGGARRVADAADLALVLETLLGDDALRERMGRAARGVLESNRGALERNVDLVRGVLAAGAGSRGVA